jgi:hypothetical protein
VLEEAISHACDPSLGQPSARSRPLTLGEVQRTGQDCRFLEGDPTTSDETLWLSKRLPASLRELPEPWPALGAAARALPDR